MKAASIIFLVVFFAFICWIGYKIFKPVPQPTPGPTPGPVPPEPEPDPRQICDALDSEEDVEVVKEILETYNYILVVTGSSCYSYDYDQNPQRCTYFNLRKKGESTSLLEGYCKNSLEVVKTIKEFFCCL